ncbi:hypothetical protein HL033_00250 [Neoehrlichia mikurensis]|nr:hypothetical protein IAH97_00250 [Neoehrlichia mikurensis]QXK92467.1 hypothetical protein HUN61_00250 [Neoehrlichia mikurensis]QXK93703.1 hypothetical protein HL033_00250 [Neoehrlichia mikurensis]
MSLIVYSTCNQLGYMFIVCEVSAYSINIFNSDSCVFLKSLLFLCVCNIILFSNRRLCGNFN